MERAEDGGLSQGDTVQLTINSKAQLAAYRELAQALRGQVLDGKQQVGREGAQPVHRRDSGDGVLPQL